MKYLELDKEMVENLLTEKGGMTKKRALEISLEYPLKTGCKQSLIGHKIDEDLYYKLIEQPPKTFKDIQLENDPKDVWIPPKEVSNIKLLEDKIKALEAENEYLKLLIK